MNETGFIVEVKDTMAVIRISRSSACGKCGACQLGCHQDEMLLTIPNQLHGEVGDEVELELSSTQLLKASAITYLIPLAALILGVLGGYMLAPGLNVNPELLGAGAGIFLTVASFFGIRAMEGLFQRGHSFTPRMINIIKGITKGEYDNGK